MRLSWILPSAILAVVWWRMGAMSGAETSAGRMALARSIWAQIDAPVAEARVDVAIARLKGGTEGVVLAEQAAGALQRFGAKGLAIEARSLAGQLTSEDARPVAVRTLGRFTVLVSGQPVPASIWQSRVAREILGMLLASGTLHGVRILAEDNHRRGSAATRSAT